MVDETDLPQAQLLLCAFLHNYELLFGSESCVPNMHFCLHIVEAILDNGPVSNFWTFAFERLNGTLKNLPNNKRNPSVVIATFLDTHITLMSIRDVLKQANITLLPTGFLAKFDGILNSIGGKYVAARPTGKDSDRVRCLRGNGEKLLQNLRLCSSSTPRSEFFRSSSLHKIKLGYTENNWNWKFDEKTQCPPCVPNVVATLDLQSLADEVETGRVQFTGDHDDHQLLARKWIRPTGSELLNEDDPQHPWLRVHQPTRKSPVNELDSPRAEKRYNLENFTHPIMDAIRKDSNFPSQLENNLFHYLKEAIRNAYLGSLLVHCYVYNASIRRGLGVLINEPYIDSLHLFSLTFNFLPAKNIKCPPVSTLITILTFMFSPPL